MSGIVLPIADSDSETDSNADSDAASTLTDTESEAGSIAHVASDPGSIANACDRPSALRLPLPLLPRDEARTTAAADTPTADLPCCQACIHPSHQSEAGIQLLAAALLDLDEELVRAGARSPAASYPRAVPRCPMDGTWHLRHLMRRVQQHLDSLGQSEW